MTHHSSSDDTRCADQRAGDDTIHTTMHVMSTKHPFTGPDLAGPAGPASAPRVPVAAPAPFSLPRGR